MKIYPILPKTEFFNSIGPEQTLVDVVFSALQLPDCRHSSAVQHLYQISTCLPVGRLKLDVTKDTVAHA
jgi:hypothetical protein